MRTCLVVDDSRVIRKVARRIVEDMGFEVTEAADGLEALAACRTAMPDAILLDWNMPAMDGVEFLRLLRREPGGERPRVIFCTVESPKPDAVPLRVLVEKKGSKIRRFTWSGIPRPLSATESTT